MKKGESNKPKKDTLWHTILSMKLTVVVSKLVKRGGIKGIRVLDLGKIGEKLDDNDSYQQ